MKNILLYLLLSITLLACEKDIPRTTSREDEACLRKKDQIAGNYVLTVTQNEWYSSEEGDTRPISACVNLPCDHSLVDSNTLELDGVFFFEGESSHPLLDSNKFVIGVRDNIYYDGALLIGHGYIIDGLFHFEGILAPANSIWNYNLVLDGVRASLADRYCCPNDYLFDDRVN